MKNKIFNRSVMVAAALAAVLPAQAAPNLLINGDFELDDADVANGAYTKVNAGDTTINGWTVGGTSVDLIQNAYGAITNVSVDLSGTPGPGSVVQTFNQLAGQTYTLTWDFFKNGGGTSMTVEFGELAAEVFAPVGAVTSVTRSFTASATNALALVRFSGGSGYEGPTLDNVVLTVVPEPAGYALACASLLLLGAAVRRQRR